MADAPALRIGEWYEANSFEGQTFTVSGNGGRQYEARIDAHGEFEILREIIPPPPPPTPKVKPGDLDEDMLDKMVKEMPSPFEHLKMKSSTPGYGTVDNPEDSEVEKPRDNDADFQLPPRDNAFDSRLSSIMTDNKYDRRLRGRTRGKLDMTNLYKVPMNRETVFTQKQARKNKKYNVIIIVDTSGSMNHVTKGTMRSQVAAEATAFLVDTLQRIGIDTGVIQFNRDVFPLKELTEDFNPHQIKLLRKQLSRPTNDNNDYQALSAGLHMLKGREREKNIILFLSDGEPAGGGAKERTMDTLLGKKKTYIDHDAANKGIWEGSRSDFPPLVERIKRVAVPIGIGIQSTCWQAGKNFRIDNLAQLKPQLVKILERNIQRG